MRSSASSDGPSRGSFYRKTPVFQEISRVMPRKHAGNKSSSLAPVVQPLRAMIVVCAWCEAEGRPHVLAEREPFEDRSPTHTACARHRAALFEELARLDRDDEDADAVA